MAITWGAKKSGSGVWMRIGYEISHTKVNHGSKSVKFTVKVYRDSNGINDDQVLHFGSKLGADYNFHAGGRGQHLITTRTYTFSYSDYGKKHTQSTTAQLNGVFNGTHPSVKITFSIPKRPYVKPAKPTGVGVTLTSANKAKVKWTGHPTGGEPISSTAIQYRRLDGGSWTGWKNSATLKKGSTSYLSGTLHDNHSYQYRVRSNGPGGSSAWVTSGYIRMTANPPASVKANVLSSGSDIKVTWKFGTPPESTVYSLDIQRRVNDGSWSTVKSKYGQVKNKPYTTTWTDSDPGAGSNQYRVRINNDGEGGNSGWATSNTVSTIVPPKAPDHLGPDGGTFDFNEDITLSWDHHDGGDGADQSHFKIQHAVGDGWEDVATVDSSECSYTVDGGTWDNTEDYHKWRVCTQGNTTEDYGPWSATAIIYGSTTPVVTLLDGYPDTTLDTYPLTVAWAYQQDEDVSESKWKIELWSGDDPDDEDADLLDSLTGDPDDTHPVGDDGDDDGDDDGGDTQDEGESVDLDYAFEDGQTYTVRVRSQSGDGLWSDWQEATFDVDLLPPAKTSIEPDYDADTGSMALTLSAGESVDGESADVDFVDVQRRIGDGDWITIITGVSLDDDVTLLDVIPGLRETNAYRLQVTSLAPSKATTDPVEVELDRSNATKYVFLNYGDVFDEVLRFRAKPTVSVSPERTQSAQPLLGRADPLLLQGRQRTRKYDIGGMVNYTRETNPDSAPDEWYDAAENAGVICYRDPVGHRIFGMLSDMSVEPVDQNLDWATIGFSVTKTGYTEHALKQDDTEVDDEA